MAQFISHEERQAFFDNDNVMGEDIWVGDVFVLKNKGESGEIIPFRFETCRYVLFFLDPLAFCGDRDTLVEWAPNYSEGFVPHEQSRLIKFFRVEADKDEEFVAKRWPLPRPASIFPFCQLLVELVNFHVEAYSDIQQYFYLAASEKLADVYNRAFRKVQKAGGCTLASFEHIERTGEYDGYQRSVAKCESARDEAPRCAA
jgi:hypothetical protein